MGAPWAPLRLGLLAAGAGAELPAGRVADLRKTLNDGTEMPMFGLGTWKSKASEVFQAVRHALCEAGYRHIDAAQIYMNQEQVGEGIREAIDQCGIRRQDLWVTSKVWPTDFHPAHLPRAVDRILKELGLDYVDQLLLHWPLPYARPPAGCPPDCPERWAGTDDPMRPRGRDGAIVVDEELSLRDAWSALEQAKAAGKVRSIGVSNFNPSEIAVLLSAPNATVPAVNQVEAHVFWNQEPLRASLEALGVALVAYTPLGNPGLYGGQGLESPLVAEVAEEAGLTPAQTMLNFLLARDILVVPKSVTPSRIKSNIDFELRLGAAQLARLAAAAPQQRLANPKTRPGGRPVFDDAPRQEL